jgi:hypothetical protein
MRNRRGHDRARPPVSVKTAVFQMAGAGGGFKTGRQNGAERRRDRRDVTGFGSRLSGLKKSIVVMPSIHQLKVVMLGLDPSIHVPAANDAFCHK